MRFTETYDDYFDDCFYYDEIFESFIYDSYNLSSGHVFTKNDDNYEMNRYRKYFGFWKLAGWLEYMHGTVKIDYINKELNTIDDIFTKRMSKRLNLEV